MLPSEEQKVQSNNEIQNTSPKWGSVLLTHATGFGRREGLLEALKRVKAKIEKCTIIYYYESTILWANNRLTINAQRPVVKADDSRLHINCNEHH
jgi:hypothetical protein